ncbi:hypothetical protein BDZ89DRAFT_1045967 [Hymenopellis radicata]|nr:hypothetical protein BDZ89DRAFT_1045967 [Hymenopellis radicata]
MTPPNACGSSQLYARDNDQRLVDNDGVTKLVALTCGTESFVVYEDVGRLFVDRLLQERELFQRRRNVEEEEEAADWIHEMASMTGEADRRSGQPGGLPSLRMPTRKNGRTVPVPAPLARQTRGDYCGLGQFKEGILVDFDDARL